MKIAVILVVSFVLPAVMQGADSPTLFPFKLGEDKFDNEVNEWRAGLMTNLVNKADELQADSDIANFAREQAKMSLDDLAKDETILSLAQDLYTKIQDDPLVKLTFHAILNAIKLNETVTKPLNTIEEVAIYDDTPTLSEALNLVLEKRKLAGLAFRKTAAQQLTSMRKVKMPHVQDPTPGSPNALTEFFERNKATTFSDEEKNLYKAYDLVLYTFRQNHRLIDPETDDANLLLHKNVTDPQK